MRQIEVLALISHMEKELSVLKALVAENVPSLEEIEEVEVIEELPISTPEEIVVDNTVVNVSKDKTPDEDAILGCSIINGLNLTNRYSGVCSVLKIHKVYHDNGKPRLYIDKYRVKITFLDSKMQELGSHVTRWENLGKYQIPLIKKGINKHHGENWMPNAILLDLD